MQCSKCGYQERSMKEEGQFLLCSVCSSFAPVNPERLQVYISEKVDWKILDTFRKNSSVKQEKKLRAMEEKAKKGLLVSRPPLGYEYVNGSLVQNEDASRVHSLFKTFLARNYSLNSLAKNFGLSTNGLKKVLQNRTYLGEIKFNKQFHKGTHKPLISPETFYAAQRKLLEYRKKPKKPVAAKETPPSDKKSPSKSNPLPSF